MTKWTANIILLTMAGVWAYLSISEGLIQPVSDQFIWLAGLLASGEGVGLIAQKFNKGLKSENSAN